MNKWCCGRPLPWRSGISRGTHPSPQWAWHPHDYSFNLCPFLLPPSYPLSSLQSEVDRAVLLEYSLQLPWRPPQGAVWFLWIEKIILKNYDQANFLLLLSLSLPLFRSPSLSCLQRYVAYWDCITNTLCTPAYKVRLHRSLSALHIMSVCIIIQCNIHVQ